MGSNPGSFLRVASVAESILLQLVADESCVRFDASAKPEFDGYRWVDYWHPISEVVFFKRHVYRRALDELATCLEETPT